MKGFKDSKNNFHPIKSYNKVGRKKREPFDVDRDGVKISQKQLIQMQRQPRNKRTEQDKGWQGLALSTGQLEKMYINCKSNFAENGEARHNAILNTYTGSATSHVHGRTSCEEYGGYCYYCGLNINALEEKQLAERKQRDEDPEPVLETELTDILTDVTVDETPEGEIDWKKLEKVTRRSIEEILRREKVWKKGFSVDIQEVGNARNDTPDEGGYYQFDYQLFDGGKKIEKSGTAFGGISAGDVLDMELELYNKRIW